MLKKQLSYCLLLALAFFNILCKKDTVTPVTPPVKISPYSIIVKVDDFADGPEVTWTAAKSKTFVEYKIWVAILGDSIPNNPSVANKNFLLETRKNINDTLFKITNISLVGSSGILVDVYSYRIQAIFSDAEPIISRIFTNKESAMVVNENILLAKSNNNEIFALNNLGTRLYICDTKSKNISPALNMSEDMGSHPWFFSPILELYINQTVKEAFVIQNHFVSIIDLKNQSVIKKIDYNNPVDEDIVAGFSDNNGKLYISTSENNIIILDRNANNKIIKIKGLQSNSFFRYYKIPGENYLLAVEAGKNFTLVTVKLSADGLSLGAIEKQIASEFKEIGGTFPNLLPDNNTFLIGSEGYLYDRKLNKIGKVSSKLNPFVIVSNATKSGEDFVLINYDVISKYDKTANLIQEKTMYDAALPVGITMINNQIWTLRKIVSEYRTFISPLKI